MSTCLMKQNSALLNKMKNAKKKNKQIIFKSTKDAYTHVCVSLPIGYRKKKLPGLKEWVAALKSGNYRQGTSHLCVKDDGRFRYCCLGVLSKIQGRLFYLSNNKTEKGDSSSDYNPTDISYLKHDNPLFEILRGSGLFPNKVGVNIYDIREVNMDGTPFFVSAKVNSFVSLNDDLKLTFKDIAKVIQILYKP